MNVRRRYGSDGQSPLSQRRVPGSIHGQSIWDMWWIERHWDRFSQVPRLPPVNIIPQIFRIHSFVCHRRDVISAIDIVLKHTKRRQVNVKLSLLTPWRNVGYWGMASFILNLDTWWRWLVIFTPRPLSPCEKSVQCPLSCTAGLEHAEGRKIRYRWRQSKHDSLVVEPRAWSLFRLSCCVTVSNICGNWNY